jgi:hypothetical protein
LLLAEVRTRVADDYDDEGRVCDAAAAGPPIFNTKAPVWVDLLIESLIE